MQNACDCDYHCFRKKEINKNEVKNSLLNLVYHLYVRSYLSFYLYMQSLHIPLLLLLSCVHSSFEVEDEDDDDEEDEEDEEDDDELLSSLSAADGVFNASCYRKIIFFILCLP
jgi:hypothetical protein